MRTPSMALLGTLGALSLGCSAHTAPADDNSADPSLQGDAAVGDCVGKACAASIPPVPETPPAADCGDGTLSAAEACDDGNRQSGDGCHANCLSVEPGYACHPAGQACRRIARCGDGVVTATEPCDDGNRTDGDGCSATCKLEQGFKCQGQPSACSPTSCGDAKREGAESCDDGNALPFDGCSASCQSEPHCEGGPCSSACGDGLVLNEGCDDGNRTDGDGCSADCKVEAGFTCTEDSSSCTLLNGKCVLRVPVIYRDFAESHSDFGIGCGEHKAGVTKDTLDAQGKPVLQNADGACIESASSFAEWYRSTKNNATIPSSIVLFDDGKGGFVNRYGPNGEPWLGPAGAQQQTYDGSPLFFPIDDSPLALTDMRYRAKIPAEYGYDGWPYEDSVFPGAPAHDFHFTTEVVYWFAYDGAAAAATLNFLGDDDMWVFINAKLAVDLGGAHVPLEGSVTLDGAGATRFGLETGKVYEIRVFHAERKIEGSSFKLTLRNFNTSRSDCQPICGDGIVTAGEECDDGVNDGGYEQCAAGCVLGASCGDGVVQDGEDCDDGNRVDGDACGSACRNLVLL